MARLLTNEEIEALLAGGPLVSDARTSLRLGETVFIEMDGEIVAMGRLVSERGQLRVRVTNRAGLSEEEGKGR